VEQVDGRWVFDDLKTAHSQRTLPLPSFLVTTLREHRARQLEHRLALGPAWHSLDLVFPNPWGEPRHGTNGTHQFEAMLKRAGLPHMTFNSSATARHVHGTPRCCWRRR
jgi:hypothetical protein